MLCPACQHENPPQAKFCLECGARLTGRAGAQPAARAPDSYTPKHLAELILTSRSALEGERKQVTVLFADVVGLSTLAERLGTLIDPERVRAELAACGARS